MKLNRIKLIPVDKKLLPKNTSIIIMFGHVRIYQIELHMCWYIDIIPYNTENECEMLKWYREGSRE